MINTNGFENEYIKACNTKLLIESEAKDINDSLVAYYEELTALNNKYNFEEKKKRLSSLFTDMRDVQSRIEYFYFRCIVDGLYNLLEEYGWEFERYLLTHIKYMFDINFVLSEGFNNFYLEEICDTSPLTVLNKRFLSEGRTALIYEDDNGFSYFLIPDDLIIENVFKEAEEYIKLKLAQKISKEKDEEYETYLRLKKKYEEE